MAELIDKGALVNSLTKDIDMTIEFMNNNGTDKYDGSFDGMFGQLNTLKSYKSIVSDMPTTTEAEIRAKAIDEFAEWIKNEFKTEIQCTDDELAWIDEAAEQLKEE